MGYPHGAHQLGPITNTNRYRWGHERWSPLDDEKVAKLYAAAAAAPAPQLFTGHGQPTQPATTQPIRTSEAIGTGFEAEANTERFGPLQINSDSLSNP